MPHVIAETELEWNSKSHRVMNFSVDGPQANVFDTRIQAPIKNRHHPVPGSMWTRINFDTFAAGSAAAGTAPVTIGPLLIAAGADENLTPATSAIYDFDGALTTNTVGQTIDEYIGDAYKVPHGTCVGNLVATMDAGQPLVCSWSMDGTYTAPTEAAGAAALSGDADPFPCKGLTGTVGGETLVLRQFVMNLNNETNSPNLNIVGTNGVAVPTLVNQAPSLEILAVLPALATANYFTDFTTEFKTDVSIVVGSVAGNILTITASGYQNTIPEIVDIDGVAFVRLRYDVGWKSTDTVLTWAFT